jgi:hypothetical protein
MEYFGHLTNHRLQTARSRKTVSESNDQRPSDGGSRRRLSILENLSLAFGQFPGAARVSVNRSISALSKHLQFQALL